MWFCYICTTTDGLKLKKITVTKLNHICSSRHMQFYCEFDTNIASYWYTIMKKKPTVHDTMRYTQSTHIHERTPPHQMTEFTFVDAARRPKLCGTFYHTHQHWLIYLCSPFSFFFYFFFSSSSSSSFFYVPAPNVSCAYTMEWNDYTPNGFNRKKKLTRKK